MSGYNTWEDYFNFSTSLFPQRFNSEATRNDVGAVVGETSTTLPTSSYGFPAALATDTDSFSVNAGMFNKLGGKTSSTTSTSRITGSTTSMLGSNVSIKDGKDTRRKSFSFTTLLTSSFTTLPTSSFSFTTLPTSSCSTLPTSSFTTLPTSSFTTLPTSSFTTLPTSSFQKFRTTSSTSENLLDDVTRELTELVKVSLVDTPTTGLHQDEIQTDAATTTTTSTYVSYPEHLSELSFFNVDDKRTDRHMVTTDDLRIDFDPENMELVPVTSLLSYHSDVSTAVPVYSSLPTGDTDLEEMLATSSSLEPAVTKNEKFDDKFAYLVDWMRQVCHNELRSVSESTSTSHVCAFCKKNGETREFFSTHSLKDNRGKVICPVLRSYVCPNCHATGDNAHTLRHCAVSKGGSMAATFKTPRTSSGIRKFDK